MRLVLALLVTLSMWRATTPITHAQTLNSDSYTLRMGNFNMTSGLKSSASYSLTDTVGQTAAQFFAGNGYHVKAGFQYIYTLYDFSFTSSTLLIDLGTVIPGTFTTAKHSLTVTAPGQGYSVTAHSLSPLKSGTHSIPGVSPGIWTDTKLYGFGYNLSGDDVVAEFVGPSYFRPFRETPETIMTSTQAGKNRTAEVTYKLNVQPGQPSGAYSTQVVYLAAPVY